MLPLPDWEQIPLTHIILPLFDRNRLKKRLPHLCIFIFILVGNKDIRGCIACGTCYEKGKCVFNDMVNELALKFEEADGLVVASPVYYASANATLIACLDRLFYSSHFDKTMKVGASVVCARRGGCSATFDLSLIHI